MPDKPPAGWLSNPDGSPTERWWDGDKWGDHTRPASAAPPSFGAPSVASASVPQSQPVKTRRRRRWPWAIACLIVLIAVISAASSSSSSKKTGTTSSPALVTNGASTPAATTSAAPAKPQTFTGNGSENIGTINVSVDSTLHWHCATCASDNFILSNSLDDDNQIDVNGLDQASGQTVVDASTYHDVSVDTEGQAWTITIQPGT